jgi:hypothetical protein
MATTFSHIVLLSILAAASSTLLPIVVVAAVRGWAGAREVLFVLLAALWATEKASHGCIAHLLQHKVILPLELDRGYPTSTTKPQVVLAHPHGIFTIAGTCFLPSGMRMFVDPMLLCFPGLLGGFLPWKHLLPVSPLAQALMRGACGYEALALTHHNVDRTMRDTTGEDLGVYAGGFEEIADHSTARLHASRWGYWVRQALRRGHDITFYYVLGSETLFSPTPARLSACTRWLISKGIRIPFIAPGWSDQASHPMAPMFYRHTLPHIPEPDAACVIRHTTEFMAAVQAEVDTVFLRTDVCARKWCRPVFV